MIDTRFKVFWVSVNPIQADSAKKWYFTTVSMHVFLSGHVSVSEPIAESTIDSSQLQNDLLQFK